MNLNKINWEGQVSKAMLEGGEAYKNGKGINPYKTGTKRHIDWEYGWAESQNYEEYIKNYKHFKF